MPWRRGRRITRVTEAQATGPTREIFDQLKRALGVPVVSMAHQALASYPIFFEQHWRGFAPSLRAPEFFRLGERLRADAYTRAFTYLDMPDLTATLDEPARPPLAATELWIYQHPLVLLIMAAQLQALEGPVGGTSVAGSVAAEHPVFNEPPDLVDEQQASPEVQRTLGEIRRKLGLGFLSHDYRALARWPEFLSAFWTVLKPLADSPLYEGCQRRLHETALSLARELPVQVDLCVTRLPEAGMSDEDITSVAHLTETFVDSFTTLTLNAVLVRIGLEGGTRRAAIKAADETAPKGKERAA